MVSTQFEVVGAQCQPSVSDGPPGRFVAHNSLRSGGVLRDRGCHFSASTNKEVDWLAAALQAHAQTWKACSATLDCL